MPSYISKEQTLLPDGIYDWEVTGASEKTSQNNNQKLELVLEVGPDRVKVFDNLTFTAGASWRIDAFRLSSGEILKGTVEANLEAEDCIGRKGQCSIVTETYNGRTRNKVDAYLLPNTPGGAASGTGAPPPTAPPAPKFSQPNPNPGKDADGAPDDIPF
jgi:hypothetical protein